MVDPLVSVSIINSTRQGGRTKRQSAWLGVHCSPFGVIPKRNRPNKWQLIIHLSSPEGESVNDGISKELSSLSYVRVDDVVDGIQWLGRGALMAKMNIRQAYRNVPVHPQDRLLLGMRWQGQVHVDAALPLGLRSAPLILTVLADVAQWLMRQRDVAHVDHYTGWTCWYSLLLL